MSEQNLNYGVIGNGRTAALVSDKGSIDWLCMPDFDSPSVFAKILDQKKGGCLNIIVDETYQISQKYVDHTNILRTLFESESDGSFEILDFMPLYKTIDKAVRYAPAELLRYIRVLKGTPHISVDFSPKLNYAMGDVCFSIIDKKYVKVFSKENPQDTIYVYSNLDFDAIIKQRELTLTEDSGIMISYNQKLIAPTMDLARLEYERTKVYWMNWTNRSKKFSKHNDYIERSMLVLKLMSFRNTGALLAAITTSIPETVGDVRNWDYRYCWLRDASMSIRTLLEVGHRSSPRLFMKFIQKILISKSDEFQIMYGIRGERVLKEKELTHLAGYKNSKPVRIGNAAYNQKQNDSLGYLMNIIYHYYMTFKGPQDEIEDMFEIVKNLSKNVMQEWRTKDSGIWEIRGEKEHFVSSKVMSWVALDRASKFAQMVHQEENATIWAKEAEEIKKEVYKYGWKENIGSFSQTYDNENVDASLLLMEVYGFIDAHDPHYVSTVNCIYDQLMHKGLMYRYNTPDDFGKPSSSFTVCSFWMIKALYVTGREEEAYEFFERLLHYSNHLKLFSEDIDFDKKDLLGNFPQAYSHLAMIDTALTLCDGKCHKDRDSLILKPYKSNF